jgi:hypothetical protein
MRGDDPAGLLDGWAAVDEMWVPTIAAARRLPEAARQQRVAGEWSLVETLRHLIFVTDAWFGRAVLGEACPYHPLGLAPTFEEVLAIRRDRARVILDEEWWHRRYAIRDLAAITG